MKRSLLTIILILQASWLCAQFSKSTKTIGGNIKYLNTHEIDDKIKAKDLFGFWEDEKSIKLDFMTSFGTFVSKNTELGLGFRYRLTKVFYTIPHPRTPKNIEYKSNIFAAGPYIRQYKELDEKIAVFAGLSPSFVFGTTDPGSESNENKTKYSAFEVLFEPGIIFFPHEKLGLEFTLGNITYTTPITTEQGGSGETKDSEFTFVFGKIGLGLRYYF